MLAVRSAVLDSARRFWGEGISARSLCASNFEDEMATGIVKWFNSEKGYGFITPDDGGKDLFAHHSEVQGTGFKSLEDGAKVEFEVTQGQKGLQASKIRKL
ncbi:cold shock domain protein CspD [compost metagenome]